MTNNVKVFVFPFWLSFAFIKNINFVEGVNANPINYSPNPKIPFINFCCKKGIFYDPLMDRCTDNKVIDPSHYMTNNAHQLEKKVVGFTGVFPYNEKTEYMDFYNFENDSMSQYRRQFYVNSTSLADCPKGFISGSTKYFVLFDNGFARTSENFFKAREYCLNEIQIKETSKTAVRFCIPDPCINGCIRKCCRTGFSLMGDLHYYKCRPHPVHLNISSLRSDDGMLIKPGPLISIHYQKFPKCDKLGGKITLELKDFSILLDGRMKYSSKIPTDRYCVDNKFNNYSETVSIIQHHLISYFVRLYIS